jgi:chromosome segregation ATPase
LTPDSAPADAAARPPLKLAARTTQDVRDLAHTATSAVINDEVYRSHGQWRRTLDAVKETLASLERTCESAIEAQEAGVAGLIDTLVGSATAEADAAAQQTRAQAQVEMAEVQVAMSGLQAVVDGLQADLQVERDRLKSTKKQLDIEVGERVRAESERDEAHRVCQQVVSAAQSQANGLRAESDAQKAELALARQQLDAAHAECSKLMATFQSVQRVLSLGQSGEMALEAEQTGRDRVPPGESRPQEMRGENSSDTAPALAGLVSSPVADAQVAVIEGHPEAVEDVKQMLEQVEAMYCADLNSGRSPIEVVDALTGHLRYARDVTVARSSLGECDAEALFEQQIAVLLDLKAETTFGRHLSISAYALRRPVASAQGESGTAQQTVA